MPLAHRVGKEELVQAAPEFINFSMRALIVWAGIVVQVWALLGCKTAPSPARSLQVRVLTYNIHHGEGTDGRFDYERLARIIRSVNPDLVALQEVDQKTQRANGIDQPAELARLTGLHVAFGKALDFSGGGYGNAILSRWPLLETRTDPLPSSAGHEPRAVLSVRVKINGAREPFWFASTHLDHTRDESERLAHVARLNELFAGEPSGPILLAGDLNAVPESKAMQILFTRWSDASAASPQPTIPAGNPRSRIDYVLFRPADRWRVVETRVLAEPVASDHRPLLTVLEWDSAVHGQHK
jgi:endonuclease/exonuclease/phosphatase family metal-dependent hydrolase